MKDFLKKNFTWIMVISLLFIFIVILEIYNAEYESKLRLKSIESVEQFNKNLVSAELEFIRRDIEMYGYISSHVAEVILEEIKESSKKYKIPIGLLHAIFRVESDYRFYITHPDVILKNGVKVNATGLGGVVWYFWGDSLKANNIAHTMMDLYIPEINIRASAYVLRTIINSEVERVDESNLLNRIIARYYGVYDQFYKDKTLIVTSDLWMKRMIGEIKNTGKIKQ